MYPTCDEPANNVSSGGFVHAEKSRDKTDITLVVILISLMKIVPVKVIKPVRVSLN